MHLLLMKLELIVGGEDLQAERAAKDVNVSDVTNDKISTPVKINSNISD